MWRNGRLYILAAGEWIVGRVDPRGVDIGRVDPRGVDVGRVDPRSVDVVRVYPRRGGVDVFRADPRDNNALYKGDRKR